MKKQSKDTKENERIGELTSTLQRLQADFENYKKHVEKEKVRITMYTTTKVISSLLPVIDSFDLALKNKENQEQFTKGVELIYAQLWDMLKDAGVTPIKSVGEKFDPEVHEVLMQEVKDDCDDETIVQELQKGYMFNDNVLRTSKVKIVRKKESDDNKDNTTSNNS